MHKKKHDCTTNMVAMRKLKAGRIKHMNQNKVRSINGKSWGLMTHEQRMWILHARHLPLDHRLNVLSTRVTYQASGK